MTKISFSSTLRWFMAVAVITTTATLACAQENRGGPRLAGTWDANVTIRNCATGDVIRTFASIGTFNEGGTFIGSTSGLAQASRTPEHGLWKHVGRNTYMMRFKTFNFDPAGVAINYQIVTHTLELAQDANTYFSEGSVQFYLLDGTPVMQGCSEADGTRLTLD